MADVVAERTGRRQAASSDRELLVFLAAAFGISWGVGLGGAFLLGPEMFLVGVFGPAIAAVWVTHHYEGTARSLWAQVLHWRIPWRWYALVLALPLALMALGYALVSALGGSWELDERLSLPAAAFFLVFAFLVAGGPEEPGWRGYALPRLQSRWDALTASAVLGGVWALWHAPLWFLSDLPFQDLNYPLYSLQILAACVIYTWIYNSTGGSVLLAMILHAATNVANQYLAFSIGAQAVLAGLWVAVAVAVVVRFGRTDLSRDRRVERDAVIAPHW